MPEKTFYFQPVRRQHWRAAKVYLLDCEAQLPTGVTINSITGTDSYGVTKGAFAQSGIAASGLAILAADYTSKEDERTIHANKALNVTISSVSSSRGMTYEIEIRFGCSDGSTGVGTLRVFVE